MNGTSGRFVEETNERGVLRVNIPGGLSFRLNPDDKKTLDGASITKGLRLLDQVPESDRDDNWREACNALDRAMNNLYQ